jgi:hypothetical protein
VEESEKDYLERKNGLLKEVKESGRELTVHELAIVAEDSDEEDFVDFNPVSDSGEGKVDIRANLALPSAEEINTLIVEQKKKMLLEKFLAVDAV